MNSRRKGAVGERELAAELERITGIHWERSAQRCGKGGPADVRPSDGWPDGVPRLHCESKRPARIAVREYLDQAERDATASELPVVMMRENGRTKWMALIDLERFLRALGWCAVDR
jgi:hypothetical protein